MKVNNHKPSLASILVQDKEHVRFKSSISSISSKTRVTAEPPAANLRSSRRVNYQTAKPKVKLTESRNLMTLNNSYEMINPVEPQTTRAHKNQTISLNHTMRKGGSTININKRQSAKQARMFSGNSKHDKWDNYPQLNSQRLIENTASLASSWYHL